MASGWFGQGLKNLQGQLKEFTEEVLTETTVEVDDPDTELQVAKRRIGDLERRLAERDKEVELLTDENRQNAERADSAELQLQALREQHRADALSRQREINQLQNEVQELRDGKEIALEPSPLGHRVPSAASSPDAATWFSSSPPLSPDQEFELRKLRDEVKQLKAEVGHWKGIVQNKDTTALIDDDTATAEDPLITADMIPLDQHQAEISNLQAANYDALQAQKRHFETQIASLQEQSASGSAIAEHERAVDDNDWDASGWAATDEWTDVSSSTTTGAVAVAKKPEQELVTMDGGDDGLAGSGELVRRLASMEMRYDEMQSEREELIDAKRFMEDELARARSSNAELKLTISALQHSEEGDVKDDKQSTDTDVVAQESRLLELQTEITLLRENMEVLDTQHELAIAQVLKGKSETERKAVELESTVSRLEAENRRWKERCQENDERETSAVDALTVKNQQLAAENCELTSAYNDLNDEFEAHKAEYGSLVTSNRDLTDRIDSLKADLIEYEEKYERCKADNLQTAQQLTKLTDQLEKLKYRLDSAEADGGNVEKNLMSEVDRLHTELASSLTQREKLAADVDSFQHSVDKIDSELSALRQANKQMHEENNTLRESLQSMELMAASFRETESDVARLKQSVSAYKEEVSEAADLAQSQATEETEKLRAEVTALQSENNELKSSLERYRSVVGSHGVKMVEMKGDDGSSSTVGVCGGSAGRKSDDGTTGSADDSTNGWDRLRDNDDDIDAVSSGDAGDEIPTDASGGVRTPKRSKDDDEQTCTEESPLVFTLADLQRAKEQEEREATQHKERLEEQLREALAALTEKTAECEAINQKLIDRKQEADERDELLQQSFTELKGLEIQISECKDNETTIRARSQALLIETARKDEVIATLREELQASEEIRLSNEQLLQQSEQAQQQSVTMDELIETNRRNATALAENENVMESQRNTITELQGKLETLTERQQQITEDLRRSNDRELTATGSSKEEIDQLKHQLDKCTSETSQLREANLDLQAQLARLEEIGVRQEEETKNERGLNESMRSEIDYYEKKLSGLTIELEHLKETSGLLENEKQQLVVLINEKHNECLRYHQEAEKSAHALSAEQTNMSVLQGKMDDVLLQLSSSTASGDHLRRENDRLNAELNQAVSVSNERQGQENVTLALENELTTAQQQKVRLASELEAERKRACDLAEKLMSSDDNRNKTEKELERLRAHLVQMEDTYTREAVTSEEREAQLRSQLRQLTDDAEVTRQFSHNSASVHQDEVEDLKIQLRSLSTQRDSAVLELAETQQRLTTAENAVKNLQALTRELQTENDSQTNDEITRVRATLVQTETGKQKLEKQLMDIRQRLEDREASSAQFEAQISYLKAELNRKDADIQEFEQRLGEFQQKQSASTSKSSSSGSKAVDKELLKNLFLGYFSARKHGKQDEVAQLLGSVLGFSDEDWRKVESSSAAGWLGFLKTGGGARSGSISAEHSVTQEFIRFLEQESAPAPVGPHGGKQMSPPPLPYTEQSGTSGQRHNVVGRGGAPMTVGFGQSPFADTTASTSSLLHGELNLPSLSPAHQRTTPHTSSTEILKEVLSDD